MLLEPIFKSFMPVNEVEYNQMLIDAFNVGMISRKTMIAKSTLVSNPDEEISEVLKYLEEKAKIIDKNNVK